MKKIRVFKPVRRRRKPSARAGRLVSKVVFTSSGTYTPPPSTHCVVMGSVVPGGGPVNSASGVVGFGGLLLLEGRAGAQSLSRKEANSQSSRGQDVE